MSKKVEKILEHVEKYLMKENNTCGSCLETFKDFGIIEYDDFLNCKRCAANITIVTCQAQKKINLKRMTELLIKFDKL